MIMSEKIEEHHIRRLQTFFSNLTKIANLKQEKNKEKSKNTELKIVKIANKQVEKSQ